MTDSSCFNFELSLIKDNNIYKLVRDILNTKVPDYISIYPASSTMKYHPVNQDGTPETIVQHTKSVTRILSCIINHPMISTKFSDYDKDIMIAGAILHDSVKYGLPDNVSTHTVHRHPILVSLLYPYEVDKSSIYYKIFTDIVEVIISHHGPWRTSSQDDYVLPAIINDKQYYLHMSDFLASRRFIHVDQEDSDDMRSFLR